VKIDEGQQKIKIVRTNRQSNLRGSCQSIFSLSRHHPTATLTHKIKFYFRQEIFGETDAHSQRRKLGWCWQREKIDWQEPRKFDCRLVLAEGEN